MRDPDRAGEEIGDEPQAEQAGGEQQAPGHQGQERGGDHGLALGGHQMPR